jgi:hypothetical protein
MMNLKT